MQHVNIKIFATKAEINLVDTIPIFHRWIQDGVVPELMIDVADYKHVPDGPGVMLIGFEADYSLDEQGGRLGLLYNRKLKSTESTPYALSEAYNSAVHACKILEEESTLRGKLAFDQGDLLVIINDRLVAPNNEDTWDTLKPEFTEFFDGVFGKGSYTLQHVGEPRDRFMVSVKRG